MSFKCALERHSIDHRSQHAHIITLNSLDTQGLGLTTPKNITASDYNSQFHTLLFDTLDFLEYCSSTAGSKLLFLEPISASPLSLRRMRLYFMLAGVVQVLTPANMVRIGQFSRSIFDFKEEGFLGIIKTPPTPDPSLHYHLSLLSPTSRFLHPVTSGCSPFSSLPGSKVDRHASPCHRF